MKTSPFPFYVFILFILFNCSPKEKNQSGQPNILFILVDDLGYADLSCHNSPDVLTPNIDAIADNGILFTDGYVTAPQCSPARAGILTGKYQQRFGHEANPEIPFVEKFGLDPDQKTMPEYLKEIGYTTIGVGKWDLGSIPSARPWNRGFDHYFGCYSGARSFWSSENEPFYPALRTGDNELYSNPGEYLTDLFTNKAMEYIKNSDSNKPWFAFLSYTAPHWPMEAKEKDLNKFKHVQDLHRRTFLAMMWSLDENIGHVISMLKNSRQIDNTLIVFLSDNGGPTGKPRANHTDAFEYGKTTSLNTPLKGVKGDVFEGGIRVPMLIQWGDHLPKGINYSEPVISLDLIPTFVAAGSNKSLLDSKLDGIDILPYLKGEKMPERYLYWRWFNQWAVRKGNMKLVKPNLQTEFLYDLSKDISEQNDIKRQFPKIRKELKQEMIKWNDELQFPMWRYPKQIKILSQPLK